MTTSAFSGGGCSLAGGAAVGLGLFDGEAALSGPRNAVSPCRRVGSSLTAPRKPERASTHKYISTFDRNLIESTPPTVGILDLRASAARAGRRRGEVGLGSVSLLRYTSMPVAVISIGFGLLWRSRTCTGSAVQ